MPRLWLIRHGESVWNRQRRFIGWGDPPLSPVGCAQARAAGRLLAAAGANPEAVFCSRLVRACQTLDQALDVCDAGRIPACFSWRLNELHCGQWQGRSKPEVADERLAAWRADPSARPPLLEPEDPRHPRHDPRYHDQDPALLPSGESQLDLLERLRPFWREQLLPSLSGRDCVWVVAHSGSLWGLARLLYETGGQDLPPWILPPANPLCLELDRGLRPVAARFLDRGGENPSPLPAIPALRSE